MNTGCDFLADGLALWWKERKQEFSHLKQLVINMNSGPECNGHRSQFLSRMVDFADNAGLMVRLIYYPPYHSKYNSIERYWAGLEKSWNGYLLDSVTTILNRAAGFTWKGTRTTARLLEAVCEKGIRLCVKEKNALEQRLSRLSRLYWWDITNILKLYSSNF